MVRGAPPFSLCILSMTFHDTVWAPSAIPFAPDYPNPKELTEEKLDYVEKAFLDAVERCKKIGCMSHLPLFAKISPSLTLLTS